MTDDTIAAISTPLGEGGIGIVRLSGKEAIAIVEKLFTSPVHKKLSEAGSHTMVYGFIKDPYTGATVDEVLVTVMKAPRTYTREDVAEINCHGGILPLRKVLELALHHGARLAEPGEFTKRAFLNGRIDLSQAEAVIDLIRSKTDESRQAALEQLSGGLSDSVTSIRDSIASVCVHIEAHIDFPDEEIEPASLAAIQSEIHECVERLTALSVTFDEGRFFRDGLRVAIVGRPNVGKSSLLNALLLRDRAIVTETAGTTRDVLEEYLNIKGLPVRVMDTAGIRESHDLIEREGVVRSLKAIDDADVVVGVIDGSSVLHDEDITVLEKAGAKKTIIAINKSDLPAARQDMRSRLQAYSVYLVNISATKGEGLESLKDMIVDAALIGIPGTTPRNPLHEGSEVMVTNIRHKLLIDAAVAALARAFDAFDSKQPLEIVAMEIRDGLDRLGEIVGAVTTEDILKRIFSEFCIGK